MNAVLLASVVALICASSSAEPHHLRNPKTEKTALDKIVVSFREQERAERDTASDDRQALNLDGLVEPYCAQLTDGLPAGECTCGLSILQLAFSFSCGIADFGCESDLCPRGSYTGTIAMLGLGITSTVKYSIAGQDLAITGSHCSDDPQTWCSCSATLNGKSCQGCRTDSCTGLLGDPDCANVNIIWDIAIPNCIGVYQQ